MRTLIFLFIFLINATSICATENGEIILLFGTPCAGKSTLASELTRTLPGNFRVVKKTNRLNVLRNESLMRITGKSYQSTKEILNVMLELPKSEQLELKRHSKVAYLATLEDVKEMSDRGENVILDVCLCRLTGIDTFDGYPVTKVLVYAPLHTVSLRERVRGMRNKSSTLIRQRRRKTILDFYCNLYQQCGNNDQPLDFISATDVENYETITKNKVIYPKLLEALDNVRERYSFDKGQWVGITPTVDHDIAVNTGIYSVKECAANVNKHLHSKSYSREVSE